MATFQFPDETVAELVARYEELTYERDDTERERRTLTARLERIKELYKWGDLTREAYLAERDELEQRLTGLQGSADRAAVLRRVAAFLRDLPDAWDIATPEERNALARTVFQTVEIASDLVTAIVPQPEFAPFFNLLETSNESDENSKGQSLTAPDRQVSALAGGSDGDRCRHRVIAY